MKRSKKDIQPYWRPNFVDASALPDIKAIRTDFIINIVALVLMLTVGFYVLQREYQAYSVDKRNALLEREILIAEPDDAANLKLSREFKDKAKHVAELEKFYMTPVLAHEFLAWLSTSRPEDLIYRQVAMTELISQQGGKVVSYQINISGDVRDLDIFEAFKEEIAGWEKLNTDGYTMELNDSLQGRNADTGIFPYALEIILMPEKKKQEGEGQ